MKGGSLKGRERLLVYPRRESRELARGRGKIPVKGPRTRVPKMVHRHYHPGPVFPHLSPPNHAGRPIEGAKSVRFRSMEEAGTDAHNRGSATRDRPVLG